jgi:hypothetical protein
MTDVRGPDNLIAAYEASLAHHANVVRVFSLNFVNVFALFNAGGFAAIVAVMPTEFGKNALQHFPYTCYWIIILFALGFLFSSALMTIIFSYSLRKYRYYREVLKSPDFSYPSIDSMWFYIGAYVMLLAMLAVTVIAIVLSLVVITLT